MIELIDYLLDASLVLILLLFVVQTVRLWRRDRQWRCMADSVENQEKMATLGHLLAGIAHELRTPLGAVSCSLDTNRRAVGRMTELVAELENSPLAAADAEKLAQVKKTLNSVEASKPVLEQALERIGQLVRQLRLAGRGDHEDPVPVDVNGLVRGALVLLTYELKQGVEVDLQLRDIPAVSGWPGPLGQVFLNLIQNAGQAMDRTGTITVTSGVDDGQVVVTVSDTGPGLPAGCQEKLFSPGWTTRHDEDGTGLGLFISKRIVDRHGGRIKAADGESGGAVFVVTLPAAAGDAPQAAR
ncbi:MAG: ATP-binding protein [Candidatus Krumholzibacteriota bacterium]